MKVRADCGNQRRRHSGNIGTSILENGKSAEQNCSSLAVVYNSEKGEIPEIFGKNCKMSRDILSKHA